MVLVLSQKQNDLVQICDTQLLKLRKKEKEMFYRHFDCSSIRREKLKQAQNKIIVRNIK